MATLSDRFWSKVQRGDGCWTWTGSTDQNGYGMLAVKIADRWVPIRAPRVAFFLKYGRWPLNALHTCDNPPCVRDDHIFEGTKADNVADMLAKGRGYQEPAQAMCDRGLHQMTGRNVVVKRARTRGGKIQRSCRECANDAQRRRRERNRRQVST